jgi:hypothetical protein
VTQPAIAPDTRETTGGSYRTTIPFRGDLAKAFDMALAALTPIGFRVIRKEASSLELAGPGMTSTKQSALLGASRLHLAVRGSELSVDAELGGVQRMSRFILYFPPGLCLFLFIVVVATFALVSPQALGRSAAIAAVATGANAVIWVLLAPLLVRHVRRRSCRAVETLALNVAAAGSHA